MLPLVISGGEPAGIGPEIIAASWNYYRRKKYTTESCIFFTIGDANLFAKRGNIPITVLSSASESFNFYNALPVLHRPYYVNVTPGIPNRLTAKEVQNAIAEAVLLCHQQYARAMITAPIDKNILQSSNFVFPGHTNYLEWLDRKYGKHTKSAIMLLACDDIRCVPVTLHVSLRKAITDLTTTKIINTATIFLEALHHKYNIPIPKLAVSGLNPHAGENGLMGDEEQNIINPAIEKMRIKANGRYTIDGPFPADSLFIPAMRKQYDGYICMYHDQALIPIKTLAFERAINITLGLNIIRTSPDHGTAYNLVGSKHIDPTSMIIAIKQAAKLSSLPEIIK